MGADPESAPKISSIRLDTTWCRNRLADLYLMSLTSDRMLLYRLTMRGSFAQVIHAVEDCITPLFA